MFVVGAYCVVDCNLLFWFKLLFFLFTFGLFGLIDLVAWCLCGCV